MVASVDPEVARYIAVLSVQTGRQEAIADFQLMAQVNFSLYVFWVQAFLDGIENAYWISKGQGSQTHYILSRYACISTSHSSFPTNLNSDGVSEGQFKEILENGMCVLLSRIVYNPLHQSCLL